MLTLIPISLLLGAAMLWVFGHTSNQKAIQAAKRRVQARLYEMRLFTDEPSLVWKAQIGLLSANARYLTLMLVPAAILTIPMVLLFAHLEAWYGMAPLPTGRATLVTVQMKTPLDTAAASLSLSAPPEIAVETPPVRVLSERQVSWRIRPKAPVSGVLRIVVPGGAVEKTIRAGAGRHYISERRVSGLWDLIWHPAESRLPAGNIDWIEIRYPAATMHWLGLDLNWLIWLVLLSMLSALLLKGRFGVTL
jgi:hypothetical protein